MIILDTNVISALMRDMPDAAVVTWLDTQPAESVWTTAITLFEIRFGLTLLPAGRRRRGLEQLFAAAIEEDLQGRVLPFDEAAAEAAAKLAAARQRAGRPVDLRDTQIAGIAIARRGVVATRNLRHFQGMPLTAVDPWSER